MSTSTESVLGTRARTGAPLVTALQAGAAILFALSQLVRVVDPDWLVWIEPLDGLFKSGNLAVTVLLAAQGCTIAIVLTEARTRRAAELRVLAHVGAIWLLLALVCIGAAAVQQFDSTDPETWERTRSSIVHVLTFSWNTWITDHPLGARADLLSLWYFSIAVQLIAVVSVAGLLLRRWPRLLGTLLVAAAVGSAVYRAYLLDDQGWFAAALSTPARADAFLLGAAVVFLVPALSARTGAGLSGAALLGLLGLVISSSFLDVEQIFRYQVPLAAVLTTMFVAGAHALPDPRSLTVQLLTAPELVNVSRAWPHLVGWSLLVVLTVQRHTLDQPPIAVTSTAVIVLALVVTLSHSVLDRIIAAFSSAIDARARPGKRRAAALPGGSGAAAAGTEDRRAGREPPTDT